MEGVERLLEPGVGDSHVGVDEGKQFRVGVSDAGVSGRVGGLDVGLAEEGDAVVVVGSDDVGGAVGGGVVDDEHLDVMFCNRGKERVESAGDPGRIVVDGDNDGNLLWEHTETYHLIA